MLEVRPTTRIPSLVCLVALSLAIALPACSAPAPEPRVGETRASQGVDPQASVEPEAGSRAVRGAPTLDVRVVVDDLDHPWDVQEAPKGRLIVSERDRARISVIRKGKRRTLLDLSSRTWVEDESGLMSLAVDRKRRMVWSCYATNVPGGHDVRVIRLKLDKKWKRVKGTRTLISGFPTSSGRHAGCRVMLDRASRALFIGTGDGAIGTTPQDLDSLGGKVLRIHRDTGAALPDNPWASATTNRRFVWTYGHRNVQGLAQRGDGSVWSVEHGPSEDDEVNRLVRGGNYGWNPVPGYESSVPMTDHDLPGDQVDAQYTTGSPTRAISGAAWVRGSRWGDFDGALAVAALKDEELLFLRFDAAGGFGSLEVPDELTQFGRLRSVTAARNGDLLVTTDNGDGDDVVLRVSPR